MKLNNFFIDGDLELEIKDNIQIILVSDEEYYYQVFADLITAFGSKGALIHMLNQNPTDKPLTPVSYVSKSDELRNFVQIIAEDLNLLHFMEPIDKNKIYILKVTHLSLVPELRKGDIILFFRPLNPEEKRLLNIKDIKDFKLEEECLLLHHGENIPLEIFKVNSFSKNFLLTTHYNVPKGVDLIQSPSQEILFEHCFEAPPIYPSEHDNLQKKTKIKFNVHTAIPPQKEGLVGTTQEDSYVAYQPPIDNKTKRCIFWKEGKCSLPKDEMPFSCKIYPFLLSGVDSKGIANFSFDYSYKGLTINNQTGELRKKIDEINNEVLKNLDIMSYIRQTELFFQKKSYIGNTFWTSEDIRMIEFNIFYKLFKKKYYKFSLFEKIAIIWNLMQLAKDTYQKNFEAKKGHDLAIEISKALLLEHNKIEHEIFIRDNYSLIEFLKYDYKKWVGEKKLYIKYKGEIKFFDGRDLQEIELSDEANQFLFEVIHHMTMSNPTLIENIEIKMLQYIEYIWWILSLSKWILKEEGIINKNHVFQGVQLFVGMANSNHISYNSLISKFKQTAPIFSIHSKGKQPFMQLTMEEGRDLFPMQYHNKEIKASIEKIYNCLQEFVNSKHLINFCYLVGPKDTCFGIPYFYEDKSSIIYPCKIEAGMYTHLKNKLGMIPTYRDNKIDHSSAKLLFSYLANKMNPEIIALPNKKDVLVDTNVLENRDIMYVVESGKLNNAKIIIHPAIMHEIEEHKNSNEKHLKMGAVRAYELIKKLQKKTNLQILENEPTGKDSIDTDNILVDYCKKNDVTLITNDKEIEEKCILKSVSCFLTRKIFPYEGVQIPIEDVDTPNLYDALTDITKEKGKITILFPRATIQGRTHFSELRIILSEDLIITKAESQHVHSKLQDSLDTI